MNREGKYLRKENLRKERMLKKWTKLPQPSALDRYLNYIDIILMLHSTYFYSLIVTGNKEMAEWFKFVKGRAQKKVPLDYYYYSENNVQDKRKVCNLILIKVYNMILPCFKKIIEMWKQLDSHSHQLEYFPLILYTYEVFYNFIYYRRADYYLRFYRKIESEIQKFYLSKGGGCNIPVLQLTLIFRKIVKQNIKENRHFSNTTMRITEEMTHYFNCERDCCMNLFANSDKTKKAPYEKLAETPRPIRIDKNRGMWQLKCIPKYKFEDMVPKIPECFCYYHLTQVHNPNYRTFTRLTSDTTFRKSPKNKVHPKTEQERKTQQYKRIANKLVKKQLDWKYSIDIDSGTLYTLTIPSLTIDQSIQTTYAFSREMREILEHIVPDDTSIFKCFNENTLDLDFGSLSRDIVLNQNYDNYPSDSSSGSEDEPDFDQEQQERTKSVKQAPIYSKKPKTDEGDDCIEPLEEEVPLIQLSQASCVT